VLKCATSLWSADLANLAVEMKRVEPYSHRFHIDVADGHYVNTLLFFPDLVRALRKHTRLPLEVHLMTTDPLGWVEPFAKAGADAIIFCLDSAQDPARILSVIRSQHKMTGISLRVTEPVDLLEPYWNELDIVTIVGTAMGIKGGSMDSSVPGKIHRCRQIIKQRRLKAAIEADGGIRRDTVSLIHAAGADYIVPGSLMFGEDPKALHDWLVSL
jgi:ribulose-phosphate 3-epimerase